MKLYLLAVLVTIASIAIILNACILHESTSRAVPFNLYQLK